MDYLERLDAVLKKFEDSADSAERIKALTLEIVGIAQEVKKDNELMQSSSRELATFIEKANQLRGVIENYTNSQEKQQQEFLMAINTTLLSNHNAYLAANNNMSDALLGSIKTARINLDSSIRDASEAARRRDENAATMFLEQKKATSEIKEALQQHQKKLNTLINLIYLVLGLGVISIIILFARN